MTTTSASTPDPPYYAVIFTSVRTDIEAGYQEMNEKLYALLESQPGFLGHESYRNESGFGTSVCYWQTLEAISNWKKQEVHLIAQNNGREQWYQHYKVRISKVERDYEFNL